MKRGSLSLLPGFWIVQMCGTVNFLQIRPCFVFCCFIQSIKFIPQITRNFLVVIKARAPPHGKNLANNS